MARGKNAPVVQHRIAHRVLPFPPRRDFASLSVADLLEARDAYHVFLSSLQNVVATAIGRYLIHEDDWYAKHPPDEARPAHVESVTSPRTLANSVVRPWSWPAVLVFVRDWEARSKLEAEAVPRMLYLPDGRVIPTCVVLAEPDESILPPVSGPAQVSALLGGGYSCLREHQGAENVGTLGCLVKKDGTYYALTSRHVAGSEGEVVRAFVRDEYRRIGVSSSYAVGRLLMAQVFKGFAGQNTYLAFDAGLVRIDDITTWTSQVFGIGEVGDAFDATENCITLDLIGCPLRAFGGTSGVMEGEIRALFFRYQSLGGFDQATDVLVGPRRTPGRVLAPPLTRPGDSGTLWFYDPPNSAAPGPHDDFDSDNVGPDRPDRVRRLRPVAMQWGGQRFLLPDGSTSAFALASFVSSVCRALDVELVRDHSTGHDEYWGKIGHFAIGWKACDLVRGKLGTLLSKNQKRIGFDDKTISSGSSFRVGRAGFVPLADVPDYVWVTAKQGHANEAIQHFADVDIFGIDGGATLLDRCVADPKNVSARVWNEFFEGFKAHGVGPDEGALPFRVWQLWDAMVAYLKKKDVLRFVAAAGVLAHYVGDASQPLHCSYLHHGVPPLLKVNGRQYPVRHDSDAFKAFKATSAAKIHGLYEETMLEVDPATALAAVSAKLSHAGTSKRVIKSGHDAAVQTVRLMADAHRRLPPKTIIAADDPSQGPTARARALWNKKKIRDETITSLADSVRLLADLWTAAWKVGKGDLIADAKLVLLTEAALEKVYRAEADFVPSKSLAELAKSGDFEP